MTHSLSRPSDHAPRSAARSIPPVPAASEPAQPVLTPGQVDRAPVVRVDQQGRPQLGALVDVGHPRRRHLHRQLGQRVRGTRRPDPPHPPPHVGDESGPAGRQQPADEGRQGGLVRLVGVEPAGPRLGLAPPWTWPRSPGGPASRGPPHRRPARRPTGSGTRAARRGRPGRRPAGRPDPQAPVPPGPPVALGVPRPRAARTAPLGGPARPRCAWCRGWWWR